MQYLDLQELPAGMYSDVWFWLYSNDMGNMKEVAEKTRGYVKEVTLSDDEALLFTLKWL